MTAAEPGVLMIPIMVVITAMGLIPISAVRPIQAITLKGVGNTTTRRKPTLRLTTPDVVDESSWSLATGLK
jgi:hypothetical protein